MKWGPIVLIIVGVVFLAGNLKLIDLRDLAKVLHTWWPALLILIGVIGLVNRGSRK